MRIGDSSYFVSLTLETEAALAVISGNLAFGNRTYALNCIYTTLSCCGRFFCEMKTSFFFRSTSSMLFIVNRCLFYEPLLPLRGTGLMLSLRSDFGFEFVFFGSEVSMMRISLTVKVFLLISSSLQNSKDFSSSSSSRD